MRGIAFVHVRLESGTSLGGNASLETRKLISIAIDLDKSSELPLRWALFANGEQEPFLKANRSFKTREDAFKDAERLLLRLKKRYVRQPLEKRPPPA